MDNITENKETKQNKKRYNGVLLSSIMTSYKTISYKYEPKNPKYLSEKLYKQVLKLFFIKFTELLISTGVKVKLPNRLGSIQIIKYKQLKKKVDQHNTKIYYGEHNKLNPDNKKYIYHNNRVTNGYMPRVHWYKLDDAKFKHKRFYSFGLVRTNVKLNRHNKNRPKYILMEFFKDKGYLMYEEVTIRQIITERALRLANLKEKKQKALTNKQ